jgi:putative nucleotidyltransferase with HDIG domain
MSKFEKFKAALKKWKIYFFFLLSIAAVSAIFPRQAKFGYEFQKGKPWLHETLVAPFDFPIYKSDAVIEAERDSLSQLFQPYFRRDTGILVQKLSVFSNEIFPEVRDEYLLALNERGISSIPGSNLSNDSLFERYFSEINQVILDIYQSGVVDDPVRLENLKNESQIVNIVQNQVVEEVPKSSIFTPKTGYEYFTSELKKIASQLQPGSQGTNLLIHYLEPANLVEPNLSYDESTSQRMLEAMNARLSLTEGMVQSGEKIIGIGEPVNDEKFRIIQSLRREYERNTTLQRNYDLILAGQILLISLAFIVLYLFLYHFRKEVLLSGKKTFFILMLVVLMSFMASLAIKSNTLNLYVIPFVILPIIVKTFYDARIALFVHLVTILLIGFWAPNGFEFIYMNFIAGVITIFTLKNLYRRGVLFVSAIFALLSYSLVFTGISLIQEGRFQNIEYLNYAWFAGNALLVLASYPLIYIFEKLFGFVSDATLVELSDTNQPLLRQLAEKAPGTFQHSMQVANLAEEAALAIGGNPLLIRTGALYHDIGKMEEPMYFIENLTSNYNPHDNMEFEESAKKIIGHVTRGVEMGRKHNLPEIIIDFIRTHHGTSTVQYFYRSYLKKYPEAEVDVAKFSYPGPKPYSKETAILMMADSVEAASRSLKAINKEIIRDLVENIIEYQYKENQFENVDLTFKEINTIKNLFRKRLVNIYHARVEYPE